VNEPDLLENESRLLSVVQTYQSILEGGGRPDRQALLAAHADLAELLPPYLDTLDALHAGTDRFAAAAAGLLAHGSVLGDHRIVREIGRGGMGVVYEAVQLSLGRRVALKVLPLVGALDDRHLARFKNEAQAVAQLHHTNIVSVFGVGCERGVHYYAMQLIEGQSLAELIGQLRDFRKDKEARRQGEKETRTAARVTATQSAIKRGDSLSLSPCLPVTLSLSLSSTSSSDHYHHVARLMLQAAHALDHAHERGVIHRDIKPANLLIDAHGQLWITDFGLAQLQAGPDLTQTGDVVGTLRYTSPEQASGQRTLDHRSDLYSLGATFYEMLTLQPVFTGSCRIELQKQIAEREPCLPRRLERGVPVELETIVLKCLAKSPAERYASGRDLADDLERFLNHRPIRARRPTLLERARKVLRRHPRVAAALALAVVLGFTGLLINQALLAREQARTEEARRREQLRADQAERRLQQTRQLVNLLIELSEEDLDTPHPPQGLRKRLVEAALAHSQELIDQGDDGAADLAVIRERLKRDLADLTALRDVHTALLLQTKAVVTALGPTEEQRSRLNELIPRLVQEWAQIFYARKLTLAQKKQRYLEHARASEKALNEVLREQQRIRLRQIALQTRGLYAFRDAEVAAILVLTPGQRQRIRELEDEIVSRSSLPGDKGFDWWQQVRRLREAYQRCVELLTSEQKAKWNSLIGERYTGPRPFFPPPRVGPARKGQAKANGAARTDTTGRNGR
jgi:serine/threonine protein kinase